MEVKEGVRQPLAVKFQPPVLRGGAAREVTKIETKTETPAAVVENDEVSFETETPVVKTPAGKGGEEIEAPKLNFGRFKDILGEDVDNEDDFDSKLRSKFKEKDEKLSKLEVLAQGKSKLNEDKEYQNWNSWAKAPNDKLLQASLINDYIEDGLDQATATKKAEERIGKLTPEQVEDGAREIRRGLKNSISAREQEVNTQLESATKEISFTNPNKEFEEQAQEGLSKTGTFLGMKLPSDEKERSKMLNKAYISPTDLNTMLKNPETYAKVNLFLKYEKQWTEAISNRTNGKATVLDKLPKSAPLNTTKPKVIADSKQKGFSEKGFLGR